MKRGNPQTRSCEPQPASRRVSTTTTLPAQADVSVRSLTPAPPTLLANRGQGGTDTAVGYWADCRPPCPSFPPEHCDPGTRMSTKPGQLQPNAVPSGHDRHAAGGGHCACS